MIRSKTFIFAVVFLLLGVVAYLVLDGKGRSQPESEEQARSSKNAGVARSAKAARASRRSSQTAFSQFIGMKLASGDRKLFGDWADKLSRNDDERKQRLHDLKHLKRAEVISFKMLEEHAGKISTDQLPVDLPLPFFDGRTVMVRFNHLRIDGKEGGSLAGRLVNDPSVSVVLGFHNGETSGIIEGVGKIMFLDAVEKETVILRELDAVAHNADFQCNCQIHQAARKRASKISPQE